MADEPWYWSDWISIGPFTGGDPEKNAAAEKRLRDLRGAKKKSDRRLQEQRAVYEDTMKKAQDSAQKNAKSNAQNNAHDSMGYPVDPQLLPGQSPWVLNPTPPGVPPAPSIPLPSISFPNLAEIFPEATRILTGGSEEEEAPAAPVKPDKPASPPPVDPDRMIRPEPAPVEAPVPPPPAEEEATEASGIEDYLRLIERLYPDAQTFANPAQQAMDEFAQREFERTRLLAQLAFAGGLTKAGGKSWESIGQGFIDAAETYDQGFLRYQKALQNSADRFMDQQDQRERIDLAKKDMAVRLYSDDQKSRRTEARDAIKRRTEQINKMFEAEASALDDYAAPEERQELFERWQKGVAMGEYIPPVIDVSDQ